MKKHIQLIIVLLALLGGRSAYAEDQGSQTTKNGSSSSQSGTPQDQSSAQADKSSTQSDTARTDRQSGTKIMFSQLPAPVQKTMRAEAGGLNIENVQKQNRKGQTCYQATFDKDNMKGKLTVAEDGSLLQYQQAADFALVAEVPQISDTGTKLGDLPETVQKTIQDQAGSAKVGNISQSSQSGKTVYHAAFNDAGVHTDLLINDNGKIVARTDETALFAAPLEASQSLSLSSAPEAVQKAVREHAGSSAQVTDLDKGTWNGQPAYKVMIEKNGPPRAVVLSENGDLLGGQTSEATGAPASAERSKAQNSDSSQKSSSPKSSDSHDSNEQK